MEQLIKVTSVPFQAIRFTQNARLIPADNMTLERQKALARHRAFQSRYRAAASTIDYDYINQVKAAFSKGAKTSQKLASAVRHTASTQPHDTPHSSVSQSNQASHFAPSSYASQVPSYRTSEETYIPEYADRQAPVVSDPVSSETATAYTVQRGSFELRVARGELSYVPPLVMTVVTQYPDIHFEYTGDFNYIPPREDSSGTNMNVSI